MSEKTQAQSGLTGRGEYWRPKHGPAGLKCRMEPFTPDLTVLPPTQRALWAMLAPTPPDFVLYGGTALALRLSHRESVDFDFFSCRPFQPVELLRTVPYLKDQVVTQQSESTLSCDVETGQGAVRVSFFGGLTLKQIETPGVVRSNGVAIASLRDIFGMKCATVPQRNEIKDYLDVHALISRGNLSLMQGIACAKAIYGLQYNAALTLQALAYFDDLPESLTEEVRRDLERAVQSVSLQSLPAVVATGKIGGGVERSRS